MCPNTIEIAYIYPPQNTQLILPPLEKRKRNKHEKCDLAYTYAPPPMNLFSGKQFVNFLFYNLRFFYAQIMGRRLTQFLLNIGKQMGRELTIK